MSSNTKRDIYAEVTQHLIAVLAANLCAPPRSCRRPGGLPNSCPSIDAL